ncbi:MAG: hypothetical protein HUU20_26505 [Pirellulales bacterium]|nr:hypothetical protein [Pirellulales bacterium]
MEDYGPTTFEAEPPRRSWWSRNWLWAVPVGCLAMVLGCGGCCLGVFGTALYALKSSPPYQMALEKVRTSPQVIEELGEPIEEAGWFPTGNVNVKNGGGDALLDFDVAGPKGRAHVQARARRINGEWGLTTVEVTLADGKRIPLELEGEVGVEEAPRWNPEAEKVSGPEKE